MSDGPSRPLLAVLGLSVLAAVYVYGKPLIVGDAEPVADEPVAPADLDLADDDAQPEIAPWTPPAEPRNPFLSVELDAAQSDPSTGAPDGA